DAIKQSVFVDKDMPKDGRLTTDEASILLAWMELGVPRNPQNGTAPTPTPPSIPTPTPTPVPLAPRFESIEANVLSTSRCTKCHSPKGSAKNVPLLTREDLVNSPRDLVLPGNPDESGLVIAIERRDGKRMPPPESGSALSADEVQAIRQWIQ